MANPHVVLAIVCALLATSSSLRAQESVPQRVQAQALLDAGRYPEALRAFERRLAAGPREFEDLLGAGKALFGLHEDGRATTLFSEALGRDRDRPEPYAHLGRICVRRAQARARAGRDGAETELLEALIHFDDAIKRTTEARGYRLEAIEAAMLLEAWERARELADAILADRPDDEEARGARRAALFLEGRYEAFLAASEEVEEDDFLLRLRRLEARARLRRFEAAEEDFLNLVRDFPSAWRPWDLVGRVWTEGAALDRRIALFERAKKDWPEDADPLPEFYLGYAYGLRGDFAAAAAAFGRYLERYPENPKALRYLAQAELGRGQRGAAHAVVRRALVAHPEDSEVRRQAGLVVAAHVAARDFERALGLHQLIVAAAPDDHALRRDEASLLKEVGRIEDARVLMKAILDRDDLPASVRAAYLNDLALHHAGAGDREAAVTCLRESLEIDPNNPDAAENLGVFLLDAGRDAEALRALRGARESEDPASPRWRARYHLRRGARGGPPR